METLEAFALETNPQHNILSLDIEEGYHHFQLHPQIRKMSIFRILGRYFRGIALPFGLKLSPFYFINFMGPFVACIRDRLNLRVHPYMDNFLVAGIRHKNLARAQQVLNTFLRRCRLR